jgi:hypothetical protein
MRYDIIFTLIIGFVLGALLLSAKPTESEPEELQTIFVLKNSTNGPFSTRYEVHLRGSRVGSVHTEKLTPGLYLLEVQ